MGGSFHNMQKNPQKKWPMAMGGFFKIPDIIDSGECNLLVFSLLFFLC
jgi:hypothetical protein